MRDNRRSTFACFFALVGNILMVYVAYMICRLIFLAENWEFFHDDFTFNLARGLFRGGLMFDTSAILYTNILYIFMMLIPLLVKEGDLWQKIAKGVFLLFNSLGLMLNLGDSIYFRWVGKRLTFSVFREFSNDGNVFSIVLQNALVHWYLIFLWIGMVYCLCRFYISPKGKAYPFLWYYVSHTALFIGMVFFSVFGIRGGTGDAIRPITISNANKFVNHPTEAAIALNTPFSLIRTANKQVFKNPRYFSEKELNKIYSPIHYPKKDAPLRKKNVVIFILESFGKEYWGVFNKHLEKGKYKGYTPFLDQLAERSVCFENAFANGRQSIDGMPSVLSGIPRFVEPFFLTNYSLNEVSGIARELDNLGYTTAFFHGAKNGSMGFDAFARTTGFQYYFGRSEFVNDNEFRGDKEFDGKWAIWDGPFLQFYCKRMGYLREPFMTSIFTATSHEPYHIPEEYKDIYPEEELEIHKCIRYCDKMLEQFFQEAEKKNWYKNTIFVLTCDHTNLTNHDEYRTDIGKYKAPLLIFDPSGELVPERKRMVAQQTDIMPTILNYIGVRKPYIAYGKDLLDSSNVDNAWAVNYVNGVYQYVKGDYLLQFDGDTTKAIYKYKTDLLLKKNLIDSLPKIRKEMQREIEAIVQSYMQRMVDNELTYKKR